MWIWKLITPILTTNPTLTFGIRRKRTSLLPTGMWDLKAPCPVHMTSDCRLNTSASCARQFCPCREKPSRCKIVAPSGVKASLALNSTAPKPADAARCPLCGRPNDCQLATSGVYKGPCWCMSMEIPQVLLVRVPPDLSRKACVCRDCVAEFHRKNNPASPRLKILPGDFYFEGGLMVFTAEYHRRRGFCCGSGCRHCPYPGKDTAPSVSA